MNHKALNSTFLVKLGGRDKPQTSKNAQELPKATERGQRSWGRNAGTKDSLWSPEGIPVFTDEGLGLRCKSLVPSFPQREKKRSMNGAGGPPHRIRRVSTRLLRIIFPENSLPLWRQRRGTTRSRKAGRLRGNLRALARGNLPQAAGPLLPG